MDIALKIELETKRFIIDALGLEDVTVGDIDVEKPLFGDGLGLDSIDALELGLALERQYGLVLPANVDELRRHTASVRSLAALIKTHQEKQTGGAAQV